MTTAKQKTEKVIRYVGDQHYRGFSVADFEQNDITSQHKDVMFDASNGRTLLVSDLSAAARDFLLENEGDDFVLDERPVVDETADEVTG